MPSEPSDNANELLEQAIAALRSTSIPQGPPSAVAARVLAQLNRSASTPASRSPLAVLKTLARTRIAAVLLLAAGAIALLALSLRGGGVAFAEVLRNMQGIQSLSFRVTTPAAMTDQGGESTSGQAIIDSAGRVRQTLPGMISSIWDLQHRKALILIHDRKQAVLLELGDAAPEDAPAEQINLLEQFKHIDAQATHSVGERQFNGRTTKGFAVIRGRQELTMWVDPATLLPTVVELKALPGASNRADMVMTEFVWNAPVDESQMSFTPPEGYELLTKKVDTTLPTELELVAALADAPRVIQVGPAHGQADVDPDTREIRVIFDQPMDPGGYFVMGDPALFPRLVGQPRWLDDRTFVAECRLEPDHEYWLSVNSDRLKSFRSQKGEPAEPYPIGFQTSAQAGGGEATSLQATPPRVVEADPDNGQEDVPPDRTEIRIVFDQPMMHDSYSVVGGGPSFPKLAGEPRWLDDRTLVLDCSLEPDHEYWLSINSSRFTNFRSLRGEAAVPYPIAFITAPAQGAARTSGPRVLSATPDNGQGVAAPGRGQLRIVFDQPMETGGYSVVGGGPSCPKFVGSGRWENDRTFVCDWDLEPDHEYWVSINSETFKNFRSLDGRWVAPYPISFRTSASSSSTSPAAPSSER